MKIKSNYPINSDILFMTDVQNMLDFIITIYIYVIYSRNISCQEQSSFCVGVVKNFLVFYEHNFFF